MTKPKDPLIVVAAIAGAFGVRGEVKIKPFTDDPKACVTYGPLRNDKGAIILTPKASRLVKNALAVTAKEVTSRETAEALKSTKLYVYRSALPAAGADEFYYSDLIGLTVEMLDGTPRGRVKAVHNFGAGDILEIQQSGEKDWMLPFTQDAVPRVDIEDGRVVIDPPDMLDGDAP